MPTITHFTTHDLRFPTSLTGDGTDAMNTSCDYSSAYLCLHTSSPSLSGYGMTFTIGRGNDIVCTTISQLAQKLIGKDTQDLFSNMGATWDFLLSDPQLRWIGPEKGVIHIATGAVDNALWDMYARSVGKPVWKLVCDMSPEEVVKSMAWRYISDALTKEEALDMLKGMQAGKGQREEEVKRVGYPAYVTSAGWLGYSDAKITSLTLDALTKGFTHFKLKVGNNLADDLRRAKLIRSLIDDPVHLTEEERAKVSDPSSPRNPHHPSLSGKNPGPTGCVLMVDANQVWEVPQAIEYVKGLAEVRPWFIEEPTAPDDILGHARIRRELQNIPSNPNRVVPEPFSLAPEGHRDKITISVATGEHAHSRILFKQLLQASAIDVAQIDSCRLAGVSEVLSVLMLCKKFNIPVCPHAGGVGLCEYVIHLSLIDYILISGSMERNVLEYVDHLHEHFEWRCRIKEGPGGGRYIVPTNPMEGYSIKMYESSIKEYEFPGGSYWEGRRRDGTL
ncbi:hypothetical protein CPB83DRAFT_813577 [Crepidotus variabilis]|uniref:Mandelate racemase/muconate lactonizing enzyme C-terminal domain-containing protein n=1 Tax=Crepidotus variabilis TaxID=179855 RepID=A0A9P6EFM0_9AGAR|nr:hypothetical protein CPB83DRAFT_813577 [Crepidotus variabilis]